MIVGSGRVLLKLDASLVLTHAARGHTEATVSIDGSGLRLVVDGLKPVPRLAVRRLCDLCQTAADLDR